MSTHIVTKEQIKHSLDSLYRLMLKQQLEQAKQLKEEIDNNINYVGMDQDILLYYALLNYRYKALTDWVVIKDDSFDEVESFDIPSKGVIAYRYHFFKAFHSTLTANYTEADKHYEKARELLIQIPEPIEHAEFNYRMGYFYYQTYQQVVALDYIKKAKEEFLKHEGHEINVALCENFIGLCCIDLRHFELAEESFNKALDTFQKIDYKKSILMVRHNLAWLYSKQNLSKLAIRHVSEVTKNNPNHFKAFFVEAYEYYKLGEHDYAGQLIEKGLKLTNNLNNIEFKHRFTILKALNNQTPTLTLEKSITEGISYFEKEKLWDCIKEYADILALKFYEEDNHIKASQYFYVSNKAQKNELEKGALK
ncbi:response regulator aspartate phosphatase C [Bacillus pseudomycoides]